jgi:hypothetical protein
MSASREEEGFEEEKPIKSAVGTEDQLDLYKDGLVLRKKGIANTARSGNKKFRISEIKSIVIKHAGTLYDGKFEMTAANGIKYTVDFKSYAQPDFEALKIILAK